MPARETVPLEMSPMVLPIGTKANPVRCSKLASIVRCSMRVYLLMIYANEDDEGGPAAQIGSLAHKGVAEFHMVQGPLLKRKKAAWDAIRAHAGEFPQADADEVRLHLTPYMEDPRNIDAKIWVHEGEPLVEKEVRFTLPPHPKDPTGEPIHVWGHLDQVRDVMGVPLICDYKTGRKTGWEMLHDHAIQIAAYTYGVREHLGIRGAQPGPIIRGHGYRVKDVKGPSPDGVFFAPLIKWNSVEAILEIVRLHIGLIRSGEVNFGTGPHCTFCEFGGLTGCIDHFNRSQQT